MGNDLQVVEQKIVTFYDDELLAIEGNDGQVYVAIGQMCDVLGLDRASQVRRIRNNEILADGFQGSVNLTYPDGGSQASGVLRVDLVPLWLTGIRIKAVREDIANKLKLFQKEAAKVLWEAFREGRLTMEPDFDALLSSDSPSVQAYKMIMAMAKMARQQILLEARVGKINVKLDDHTERIESLEAKVNDPARVISAEQAMHISQAVKAVALELGSRSGRNEFQGVYGELYRRFKIPSYRELPASKYNEAIDFLRQWYESLIDDGDAPF